MKALTAAEIMARRESTLAPDTDIYEALHLLLAQKITGAPVVDEGGRLLGMLTERDCLRVLVNGALEGLPRGTVSDYMTSPAESIGPGTSLHDIVHVFLSRPYRKLPVVDADGRVVGQVSRRDTLVAFEASYDPRLHGQGEVSPPTGDGVDSAMRLARADPPGS